MAGSETQAHLPALAEHERKEVGHLLQLTLVELIALSLIGKQLHWNIVGPGFRELHLHLDELTDEWRELSDVVAERAVALGYSPDGRAPAIVEQSELRPVDAGPTQVPKAIRERIERLGDLDLTSQDVLIEVTRTLEKQLWMLRSSL
ncbi:MAG: DNA starvation/stationary phase protection protein [Actinobacteria bacterium]|nr:MAG: DNA starvation/stationary phase protection protein [Actinomycetota bacterium]